MLKKSLKKLINTMVERNTVSNIIHAKNVREVYNCEKVAMMKQLEKFEELANTQINLGEFPIERANEVIYPGVALEVSFIMIMCKINPYEGFADHGNALIEALSNDRGKYQSLSQNFKRFFKDECQPEKITEAHALKKVGLL